MPDITIMIAARNASQTIERTLRSVQKSGNWPILLIDDYSDDDTVKIAKETYGHALSIVRPEIRKNIGTVRDAGLAAVEGDYALWLDADDEILPGRVEAMLQVMEAQNADFVYGNTQLISGETGEHIKDLNIPDFLKHPNGYVRQIERNWIQGIGWPMLRLATVKPLGYDRNLFHGEDYDILLRGIMAGLKVSFAENAGHLYYDYPTSLSRNLDESLNFLPAILGRFSERAYCQTLGEAGLIDRDQLLSLVSTSLFKQDFVWTEKLLSDLESHDFGNEISDSYKVKKQWLADFYRGTLALVKGQFEHAIQLYNSMRQTEDDCELFNNLAVAYDALGQQALAKDLLKRAIDAKPNYADAVFNCKNGNPKRITYHLLRREKSRDNYQI
ncbi:MAG: glycosyltransferase [Alphaproteobacteria bacterium]|nr:glycosyltransferase [Alphaproteobacteria bacterium]